MRKTTQLKILNTSSIDELRKSFQELASKKLKFLNLDLVIFPEDFDYCCYEYLEGGVYKGKFSLRRARRMLLVEQICNAEIDYKLFYQCERKDKSVIIISELAEFCFIVLPVKHEQSIYFRFLTMVAFGRGIEGGMGRFLKKGKEINKNTLLELVEHKK
jgi:hypothetical protein